jgi:hypothetical protein
LRNGLRADVVSLAAGAVVAALGTLVLLDSSGALQIAFGWMAVALTAGIGLILLVSGLAGGDRSGSDRAAPVASAAPPPRAGRSC